MAHSELQGSTQFHWNASAYKPTSMLLQRRQLTISLFLGSRHNSRPKHHLSLAIKLNLCYNKSAQQKCRRRQIVTIRTQESSGTPVISAAEITCTQGPWLSPKDFEASQWHKAAPLAQKKAYLIVTFTISQPQQSPSTTAASFLASRKDDEMLHKWPFRMEASQGRGSSTKHWPCTTNTSQGQNKPSLMAFGVHRPLATYCPGSSLWNPL